MAERVLTIITEDEVLEKLRILREECVDISELLQEAILSYEFADEAA